MNDDSPNKFGGTCSIIVGVSYVLIGAAYFLTPEPQRVGGEQFLASFAASPFMLQLQWWLFVLVGMFGVAVVQALSQRVQGDKTGWLRWTSVLAIAGLLVGSLNNLQLIGYWSYWGAEFRAVTDPSVAADMAASVGIFSLDAYGWFGFGMVGLWILVVSVLALRGGQLPKGLAYLGFAVAAVYWLVVLGFSLNIQLLIAIAAGLGGIVLAPIWYIWAGLKLRGMAAAPVTSGMSPAV